MYRLRPGEGRTESQAAALGEETDSKRASADGMSALKRFTGAGVTWTLNTAQMHLQMKCRLLLSGVKGYVHVDPAHLC